ncbi:hypothetical protein [Candidatus Rickettsia kedanie]|uniref:hypothetical protein n=1 Tax=Candidatus Rickettsia kedanie TaxID=3115352 RepID=UPI00399D04FA
MFFSSLRKNTETSTALMHTLSEMLSITDSDVNGIGNRDASMQHGSSPIEAYSVFSKSLDKLERSIINKLQSYMARLFRTVCCNSSYFTGDR